MTAPEAMGALAALRHPLAASLSADTDHAAELGLPVMPPREHKEKGWPVEDKVRLLSEAEDLTGYELAAYLEGDCVLLAQLAALLIPTTSGTPDSTAPSSLGGAVFANLHAARIQIAGRVE